MLREYTRISLKGEADPSKEFSTLLHSPSPSPLSRRFAVMGFAIITMALLVGGLGFYRKKAKGIIQQQHQIIAAIGTLKSGQIQNWRQERQADVQLAVRGPLLRQRTGEFLHNPSSPKLRADLLERVQINTISSMYESALLLALDGQVLLNTESRSGLEDPATQRAVKEAKASQKAVFSDFFRHADGIMHIDVAAAVRDAGGQPLAVLVLRSNADAFLFPLIQTWPLPNYSAETVLVLRSGNEATVPHKLRFEAESAPRWHQPLTRTTFPAVAAVLGRWGLFEGIDYRGKQVLADSRPVPGSPWFIENKIDKDEALAQLHLDAIFIGLITGASILLVGALIAYYYRHRQAQNLRALYETEQLELAAEKALQEKNIELGVAKKASLAKSEFLSAMSHELRTPLIGITGMLEVLAQSNLDMDQRQSVDIIHESSESLLRIIGDILDFSKIEANKLELVPQTFSAQALLESVTQTFRSAISAKGLKLDVDVDPRVAPAHVADVLRLRQILNNFMSNAVKFTDQGSISLRLRFVDSSAGSESLVFEVQDTGIGVAPENQVRLFEPFTQAEANTTRRFGGTGLGLTISRRLAELMGGSLEIQSNMGQGTTIKLAVKLPVGDAPDIEKPSAREAFSVMPMRPTPSVEVAMQERSLILLAEDHPTNCTVLTQQINRAGYALEIAEDGQEAFEKWQSGRYSLLLTDLHMPRMDGYQLTQAVRDWERAHAFPRTPILALTANALSGESERCLQLGMDDFLIKPVTIPLLASKLRQWMPHLKTKAPESFANPATPSPIADVGAPSLDFKTLLDLCGGNAMAAQEIVDDFIASTNADLLVMQDCLQQKDMPCIVRQSHRIKGSAAMVGARELADRTKKLEAYAKTETAEWEPIQEQMAGIQEALQTLGAVRSIASPDEN